MLDFASQNVKVFEIHEAKASGHVRLCISEREITFHYVNALCIIVLADSQIDIMRFGWLPRPGRKPNPRGRACFSVDASHRSILSRQQTCSSFGLAGYPGRAGNLTRGDVNVLPSMLQL